MVEEKRRYIRWDKRIRVTYSLGQDAENFEEAFTQNLSEFGLQIVIQDQLQPKQLIRIKLEFVHDPVPIITDCRVVYVEAKGGQYKVGLEIVNMNDFEKERLRQCLKEATKNL